MKLVAIFSSSLLMAGLLLTAGCWASQPNDNKQFLVKEQGCLPIDDEYANSGEQLTPPNEHGSQPYMSELMFSRLPGGRLPESIKLTTSIETNQLSVTMVGKTERKLEYRIGCQSGWHILKRSRTGQYLGDGVVEKQYGQVSMFRTGRNGELVVKIFVDAEFNSMYIFNYSVKKQDLYRFQVLRKQ
jgi:hypothetical protein